MQKGDNSRKSENPAYYLPFICSKLKEEYPALEDFVDEVIEKVKNDIIAVGGKVIEIIESPIVGEKGKNKEFLALVKSNI